jgi:energy-coupling factor transport system permease protein
VTTSIPEREAWRVVDIVVAAVLAVAFGAVFQAWNLLWETTAWAFAPLRGAVYGVWMIPAVLVPMIVRRPGAALFGEGVAAAASALFGAPWGLLTLVYGLVQGGAAELVFAFVGYRRWGLGMGLVAGAAAGLGGALLDLAFYYPDWPADWQLAYSLTVVASSALIAGLGSWLLVRALARTGVLAPFPAGQEQNEE